MKRRKTKVRRKEKYVCAYREKERGVDPEQKIGERNENPVQVQENERPRKEEGGESSRVEPGR